VRVLNLILATAVAGVGVSPPAYAEEVASADSAAVQAASQHAASQKEKADGERMICRREKPLGSNLATRVCRTQAQMEREKKAAQEAMTAGSKSR